MANPNEIKSLNPRSTAEEYARRLIQLPLQPILSRSDHISGTRCQFGFHQFCDSTRRRRAEIDR
ncbi:MAG: hypothetical protein OET63_08400 [Desulfobacterales bacterium]|nr:hypothetical protein [Desulfobacterales bacterium]